MQSLIASEWAQLHALELQSANHKEPSLLLTAGKREESIVRTRR